MKVSDLFESIVTEKVAPPISSVFPKAFINKVYKAYNLDAYELPELLKSKPTIAMLKTGVVLSQGADGKFAAVGFIRDNYSMSGKGDVGLITSDQKGGGFSFVGTKEKAFQSFPTGKYFFLKYSSSFDTTRGQAKGGDIRAANQGGTEKILDYMNATFGPQLKKQVEGYLDDIFANLRKLKTDKQYTFDKSERERAVGAAEALEALVKRGFKRETMEEWLRVNNAAAYGSWGSIPTNYANFVELMGKEPNAKAKFAKMIFSRAKQLHKSVMDMLK
jgi:hypothetical protein